MHFKALNFFLLVFFFKNLDQFVKHVKLHDYFNSSGSVTDEYALKTFSVTRTAINAFPFLSFSVLLASRSSQRARAAEQLLLGGGNLYVLQESVFTRCILPQNGSQLPDINPFSDFADLVSDMPGKGKVFYYFFLNQSRLQ